jgi:chromosome segregation and condensation protein ScpB
MNAYSEPALEAAVGRKILGRKGSELIELLYFLEEPNTLEMLRVFSTLDAAEQSKIIGFLKDADQRGDVTLEVSAGELKLRPGGLG